ncbi:ferritin [Corynebacterium marinum]|jgi:ferritin|uniref:Ferritin n=2 Tax=Corynebacterium marinum TaxID=349751 RepID=A0A0B6TCQ7_9CORY|nr:ferritin [Corynebacterium marinum]AJK67732.1 ferritin [Corynebacterium marinum DSM 44953]NLF91361.1 ferritin [Corynebacterium marinum]GGO12663.1 ferritin [Corynebacterium marinum]
MKIPEKLLDTLNKQVTAEHQAALIYTQLSYDLDHLSFTGMSTWMAAQADEERVHAGKIADHILARGGRVQLGQIENPALNVNSPLDVFSLALEHERKVSEMIRNLARVADEVQDFDSRTLVNWFLNEQIEEEDTVSGIIDQLQLVGDDGAGLLRIDARLGAERSPATPAP